MIKFKAYLDLEKWLINNGCPDVDQGQGYVSDAPRVGALTAWKTRAGWFIGKSEWIGGELFQVLIPVLEEFVTVGHPKIEGANVEGSPVAIDAEGLRQKVLTEEFGA